MKTSLKIVSDNPNYLAQVIRLGPVNKHPNADKLQTTVCNGCSVITGLAAKEGNLYIYFPIESTINKEYLSYSNSFSDAELNKNKEIKGFFVKTGRVRAIKLRGMVSEGYIVPAADIKEWLGTQKIDVEFEEGVSFDYIGDIKFCEKYCLPVRNSGITSKSDKKVKRESKLVDKQFRLSLDLEHLKRNLFKLNLEDQISITYKMHGANAAMGRVLCKRPLNLIEKLLKLCRVKIQESHYDLVYASRKVIKNQYADKNHESFYSEDIWGAVAQKYKDSIKDGITLYGEIVGQQSNGGWIQKEYDYGLAANTFDFFVFRITYTNASGDVFDFSLPQIKRYCQKMGLKMVPIFYYGTIEDYLWENNREMDFFDGECFTSGWRDTNWREQMLNALIKNYTEKNCYLCKNKVPEEGVVLAVENDIVEPFKLKSLKFLERETKLLDNDEINVEDAQ